MASEPLTRRKDGERLFGAVVEDGDVFRLEVGDRLALLVAHDQVEQDFIDGGLDRGAGVCCARAGNGSHRGRRPAVQTIKCQAS